MDDERAARAALALVPGIGPARLATLLEACQTALGALSAPFAFLCSLPGMSRAAATAVAAASVEEGRRLLRRVEERGGGTLLPGDPEFPPALQEIPDPPLALFVAGDVTLLRLPAVALIGSRDHSAYGARVMRQVAGVAAGAGLAVVSGMARGLDALAHAGALDVQGATIGVLGNGLGVVYPAANRPLYERVLATGLLVTEYPPGERPGAGTFQRRNRLISGLARVTVVVEAAERSGTLVTVDAALAQGREVLAVPGPITSKVSVGTNGLIRDGAAPYLVPDDLLRHYPEACVTAVAPADTSASLSPTLAPAERDLVRLLGDDPIGTDELAELANQPAGTVLALLSALELAGVAEQVVGGRFRRRQG